MNKIILDNARGLWPVSLLHKQNITIVLYVIPIYCNKIRYNKNATQWVKKRKSEEKYSMSYVNLN